MKTAQQGGQPDKEGTNHIVFYHLLNDYSGSPKALAGVIERALAAGYRVDLYTSEGGPLDSLTHPALRRHVISYQFSGRTFATALHYIKAQAVSFFSALRYSLSKETAIYVNTILPFGAMLGARLARRPLTIHYHENPETKNRVYRMLTRLALPLAHRVVCVSKYQADLLPRSLPVEIIHNTLSGDFVASLRPDPEEAFGRKNILMLTSLKIYKGVREFLSIARLLPQYTFTLVASDTEEAIGRWLKAQGIKPAPNVSIYPRQTDVAPFYNSASVVVNLSNPRLFVESCGLTALEARACQLPVIVPTKGAIAEFIEENRDGFHIDCHDFNGLTRRIVELLSDKGLYTRIARGEAPRK